MKVIARNKFLLSLVLIGILVMSVTSYLLYRNTFALLDSAFWVEHTYEVINWSDELEQNVREIQSSERNFIVSGDSSLIDDLNLRLEQASHQLDTLRLLVDDNPAQIISIDSIRSFFDARMHNFKPPYFGKGLRDASTITVLRDNKEVEQIFLAKLNEFVAVEHALLDVRKATGHATILSFEWFVWLPVIFLGFAGVCTLLVLRRNEILKRRTIDAQKIYQTIASNIPDCVICVLDADYKFLLVEGAILGKVGYQRDELLGRCAKDVLPADRYDFHAPLYKRAFEGETFGVHLHRNNLDFLMRFVPLKNADDEIDMVMTVSIDVTELKNATRELVRSEARFRSLIENNFDAISVRDENLKVKYVSPSALRMLGYTEEELKSQAGPQALVHPNDQPVLRKVIREIMANPGIPSSIVARFRRNDNKYIWVEGNLNNLLNDPYIKGVVANFRDITERMEAELESKRVTADLIERNKHLEQYAYIVSHNLRGPVANIVGLGTLLKMPNVTDADREKSLNHIFASAIRLDEITRDLNSILEVTRNVDQARELVALSDTIEELRAQLKPSIETNGAIIYTDFSDAPMVYTVRPYLHNIFFHLITNSIKFHRRDIAPVISIISEKQDDQVIIRVADNGRGIDLVAHGNNVFGLYKRFHLDVEGKGFGIFMVKTQIESLGGSISVDSIVDQGTEFTITL